MRVSWSSVMISLPAMIYSEVLIDCLSQSSPMDAPLDLNVELYRYISPKGHVVDLYTLPDTLLARPDDVCAEGYRQMLCAMRHRNVT